MMVLSPFSRMYSSTTGLRSGCWHLADQPKMLARLPRRNAPGRFQSIAEDQSTHTAERRCHMRRLHQPAFQFVGVGECPPYCVGGGMDVDLLFVFSTHPRACSAAFLS